MSETQTETNNSQEAGEKKTKEVEVQFTVKWVNFTRNVEASSVENAIELARQGYSEEGTDAFTITANGEEVCDLEGIFNECPMARVQDEDGNEGSGIDFSGEEEED